ncbi:hypothetical protein EMPS_03232 [Entomortierella parvispora]|uniref:Survival Motor Neuron Gemin2-binding domain-containing protein n=1 Tax=Entomortierella parvispora TaxID=205924 RepID=A0A9P3LUE1_9FUNG|nr:hypothetical protein EMPS_03232 [Entomortierella parvispora]
MADENTYEDGDFEDGMEDEDMAHDAFLDEEEENVDIEIGEEIPLTHDEVWDDSELIDAWDRAVKQYEVYHSKANRDTRIPTAAPSKTNNAKDNTISEGIAFTKRARTEAMGDSSSGKKAATESNVKSVRDQPQKQNASSSSDYAVSERKPSFKKAEKSGFGHYKARQQGYNDNSNSISGTGTTAGNKGLNTNIKSNGGQSTKRTAPSVSRPKSSPQASTPPVYDAETIEYYRQMGYSYDPDYAASAAQESVAQEEEESAAVGIDDEVRQPTSTQRVRRPASRAASQSGTAARAIPPYPYPHSFGHYPGNSPHIPTPQGMPRIPNMSGGSGWGRSASVPFGLNAGGHAHAQFSYPGSMMPPGPPPPPTMPMTPPMAGSFTGGNSMDEEALGNLIMAWYYSGYYTGLYQASQRR